MIRTEAVQWSTANNLYSLTGATKPDLPPGKYKIKGVPFRGYTLKAINPANDVAIIATDSCADQVFKGIVEFIKAKDKYKRFGMLHKRGILMNSLPGFGKTMTCVVLADKLVEIGGIAIFNDCDTGAGAISDVLSQVRVIHPDMTILNIMEDLDQHNYVESLLAMMDGDLQVDNIIHIATTNYINELDERITKRPRRFDEVITIGPPSETARRSFINQVIPSEDKTPALIDNLVKYSDGLPFAHIKELIASSVVMGKPIADVAKVLNANIPTVTTRKRKRRG